MMQWGSWCNEDKDATRPNIYRAFWACSWLLSKWRKSIDKEKVKVFLPNWTRSDFIEDNLSSYYCQFQQNWTSLKSLLFSSIWSKYALADVMNPIPQWVELIDWWLAKSFIKREFMDKHVMIPHNLLPWLAPSFQPSLLSFLKTKSGIKCQKVKSKFFASWTENCWSHWRLTRLVTWMSIKNNNILK